MDSIRICPKCGVDGMQVVDSRESRKGYHLNRRRKCLYCGASIHTVEIYRDDYEVMQKAVSLDEKIKELELITERLVKKCKRNRKATP